MIHNSLNTDRRPHALARRVPAEAPPRKPHTQHSAPVDGASRAAVLQALDLVPEAVFFLNAELQIVDVNAAAANVSGYRRVALRGMRLEEVISDDGDGSLGAALEGALLGESAFDALPARRHSPDGQSWPVLVQVHFVDQDAESRLVAVVREASDPNHAGLWSDCVSDRDYLTSLPARAALEVRLRRAESRAREQGTRYAILFIDVDRFKTINDKNGHRVGDLVLQTLSRRLLSSVRPGDFVARYGGDEFVALVEDVHSQEEVDQIAQRIRDALSVPLERAGVRFQLSASVGVAMGHAHSPADQLLDQADRAMYRAKQMVSPTQSAK